jgi:hypothetical protein
MHRGSTLHVMVSLHRQLDCSCSIGSITNTYCMSAAVLAGSIPVSVGSLRRLQFINLSNNKLSGALPGLPAAMKLLNIRCVVRGGGQGKGGGGQETAGGSSGRVPRLRTALTCKVDLRICGKACSFPFFS